jgi:hypothetical protein
MRIAMLWPSSCSLSLKQFLTRSNRSLYPAIQPDLSGIRQRSASLIGCSDAGFEEECTLERFDWSAPIRLDKARLTELVGLHFIECHENVIFCGPVGVGKSFLAQALGHAACRAGYRVLFSRADLLLKTLARSRADSSFDREQRRLISPDLLVVDDFGLKKLSSQATSDFYDLLNRTAHPQFDHPHLNRGVDEWMAVLLNRCTVKSCTQGSNPCLSASKSCLPGSPCEEYRNFGHFAPKHRNSRSGTFTFSP